MGGTTGGPAEQDPGLQKEVVHLNGEAELTVSSHRSSIKNHRTI